MSVIVPKWTRLWEEGAAVCGFVFVLAFSIRIVAMLATSSYHLGNSADDFFGFGTEMGRVARSLVLGHGFSSPMPLPTGPTAIVGPVYPLFIAMVFKAFGVYSTASAVVILCFQALVGSATCIAVYRLGCEVSGASTGKIASLAWAIFPLNIGFSSTRVWETSLSALLGVLVIHYLFRLQKSLSGPKWAIAGAAVGLSALLNTSLVVLSVPFLLFMILKSRMRFAVPAIVFALSFIAVTSPWTVRNYLRFGKPALRTNFPLEFWVANNEQTYGQKVQEIHPARSVSANLRWAEIGEARFMAELGERNREFVSRHPKQFLFGIMNRVVNYWTGAWIAPTRESPDQWPIILCIGGLSLFGMLGVVGMIRAGVPGGGTFAGCLALYPMVYYLTTSQPRFYHTIAPLLIIAGARFWTEKFRKHAQSEPREHAVAI